MKKTQSKIVQTIPHGEVSSSAMQTDVVEVVRQVRNWKGMAWLGQKKSKKWELQKEGGNMRHPLLGVTRSH